VKAPRCERHNQTKRKWGDRWRCITCNREYQAQWFALNKKVQQERISENNKKIRLRNMRFVFEYKLQHPCVDCGETDPIVLDFDHIDPSKKSFGITDGANRGFSELRLLSEIDKCEVRCANCHRRRTAIQLGWYKEIKNGTPKEDSTIST
jgi:hypothetical protein